MVRQQLQEQPRQPVKNTKTPGVPVIAGPVHPCVCVGHAPAQRHPSASTWFFLLNEPGGAISCVATTTAEVRRALRRHTEQSRELGGEG